MQLGKKHNALIQKLRRQPTPAELAEEVGATVEEVEQLMQVTGANVSLTEGGDEENEYTLLDKLVQEGELGADEHLLKEAFENQVRVMLKELDEKEAKVIAMRYGLDDNDPMTLKEIGEYMSLSRERIRQIENVALRKLRRQPSIQELRGYLR